MMLVEHCCCSILMFYWTNHPTTDPPSAPTNLCVTDYNTDFVTVTWDAPRLDGGSPILQYVVEKRDAVLTTYMQAGKTDPDTRSFTVDGLFSGHSYVVRVAAENERGCGEFVETGPVTARLPYGKSVDIDASWVGLWTINFFFKLLN